MFSCDGDRYARSSEFDESSRASVVEVADIGNDKPKKSFSKLLNPSSTMPSSLKPVLNIEKTLHEYCMPRILCRRR